MLPSVAGAVAPIYNIPDLANVGATLVLSRTTLVKIFLGKVTSWSDPLILADNSGAARTILSGLNKSISFAVRYDSSGTTEIFTTALNLMDPTGTVSFSSIVGKGTTPTWCGPKTDEIQVMKVSSCGVSGLPTVQKTINLMVVTSTYNLQPLSFQCDDTVSNIASYFTTAYGSTILVTRTISSTTYTYSIGFLQSTAYQGKNWYEPAVLPMTDPASPVTVSFTTLQEGGYVNSHYNAAGVTLESQSLWLSSNAHQFNMSNPNSASSPTAQCSNFIDPTASSTPIKTQIFNCLKQLTPGYVTSVTVGMQYVSSAVNWTEYKLAFNTSTVYPVKPKTLIVHTALGYVGSVGVTNFLHAKNFPLFYDSAHPQGYANSGRYTCYRRDMNMEPLNYYTGNGNQGVIAEVTSMPYVIGYSVLQDAKLLNLPTANMINKAGSIVTATSDSVAFAVMEKGGSLDNHFTAILSDGSSSRVWPIAGYTYFIIRGNDHVGSCTQRTRAMKYLYNFYFSSTVQQIANRLGFTTLPNFIRNIIINRLIDVARCKYDNKIFALQEYKKTSTPLLANSVIASTVNVYLSAFYNLDSTIQFALSSQDNSDNVWSQFVGSSSKYAGAFTMFTSSTQKKKLLTQSSSIISAAFAHIAVVPIYHLNVFTAGSGSTLRITSDILAGIYTGRITYWNDTLIQAANSQYAKYLPFQRINVVARSDSSDVNMLFSRFLSVKSNSFATAFKLPSSNEGNRSLSFQSILDSKYLFQAADNNHMDALVTYNDQSFGYYLQVGAPVSNVAWYCADFACANGPIKPTESSSLIACQRDPNTFISEPAGNVQTYDLMKSTATGCYPIAGTVDYSVPSQDVSTCSLTTAGVAYIRVKFSSWLFSGPALTQPLTSLSAAAPPDSLRRSVYTEICNIKCDAFLGYQYCGYVDCSFENGDFVQSVSTCDPATSTRTVTYKLVKGDNCIQNPASMPQSSVSIACDHLEPSSAEGIVGYVLCVIGVCVCLGFLIFSFIKRNEKKGLKGNQLFIYIFMSGALGLNFTIISFIGDNTDNSCIVRPWIYNLFLSLMFAPIVMKLNAVDRLHNKPHLMKVLMTDSRVLAEVIGFLIIDLIILITWAVIQKPQMIMSPTQYSGVHYNVNDQVCNTGISQIMNLIMVIWKALIFLFGMLKAICTWHVTAEISEAKQFAVAITVGGIAYLVNVFINFSPGAGAFMSCIGSFLCANLACCLVMVPKLLPPKKKPAAGHDDHQPVHSTMDGSHAPRPSQNSMHGGQPKSTSLNPGADSSKQLFRPSMKGVPEKEEKKD